MKHYWTHFKEDISRRLREGWHVTLSRKKMPSHGWLYQTAEKEWVFFIYDFEHKTEIHFKGITRREAMRRGVAILKLLNEMEKNNANIHNKR